MLFYMFFNFFFMEIAIEPDQIPYYTSLNPILSIRAPMDLKQKVLSQIVKTCLCVRLESSGLGIQLTQLKRREPKAMEINILLLCLSQFQLGTSPPGNPWGLAQKTCPGGRDLTFESCPGAENSTRTGIL